MIMSESRLMINSAKVKLNLRFFITIFKDRYRAINIKNAETLIVKVVGVVNNTNKITANHTIMGSSRLVKEGRLNRGVTFIESNLIDNFL